MNPEPIACLFRRAIYIDVHLLQVFASIRRTRIGLHDDEVYTFRISENKIERNGAPWSMRWFLKSLGITPPSPLSSWTGNHGVPVIGNWWRWLCSAKEIKGIESTNSAILGQRWPEVYYGAQSWKRPPAIFDGLVRTVMNTVILTVVMELSSKLLIRKEI